MSNVFWLERAVKKINRALEPDSNTPNRLREARSNINYAIKSSLEEEDQVKRLTEANALLVARLEGMQAVLGAVREMGRGLDAG